jgi:hypothetical protein
MRCNSCGFSYKAFLAGTPLRDAELIPSQVEVALKDAERYKNALGPASLQGPEREHNDRAIRHR